MSVVMRRLMCLGTAVVVALILPGPAAANHPQQTTNFTVTFDHDGDNQWWVEVLTKTSAGDSIVAMEVRPESSSNFRGLQNKGGVDGWTKWGPETAFQIPTGDRVQFRAHVLSAETGTPTRLDSCFFTHPQGVEQCDSAPPPPPPPPPGTWSNMGIAVFSESPNDLAVGDPDRDGKREVYVAGTSGLYRLAPVRTTVSADGPWLYTAIGDADRDGQRELYAMGFTSTTDFELHRFTYTTSWQDQVIASGDAITGPMTFGDLDRDGKAELYVIGQDGTSVVVSQVFRDASGWQVQRVATITDDTTFGTTAHSTWVGDADGDGHFELVLATAGKPGSFIHVVDFTTTWTTQRVATGNGPGSVVAGSLGDGTRAVASLHSDGNLYRYVKTGSTWTEDLLTTVPGEHGRSLFLGDGDGDGRVELYAASNDAHAYQIRVSGTAAAVTDMGLTSSSEDLIGRLVVGDGDNDGKPEVYMGAFDGDSRFGHVYQYQFDPPEPPAFDASFTGVRGNEWWVQANVAASGATIQKVEVSLDGGSWKPLAKQSWGPTAWAASYHMVQGTVIQLRATSTTGLTDLSDCYQWIPPSGTNAAKTSCPNTQPPPPPGAFDATFSNVKGNEWWVEAVIKGNEPINYVFVYWDDCSKEPADMTYRADWGKWVLGNTYFPEGTKLVFEAGGSTGSDRSGGYIWTQATPTSGC